MPALPRRVDRPSPSLPKEEGAARRRPAARVPGIRIPPRGWQDQSPFLASRRSSDLRRKPLGARSPRVGAQVMDIFGFLVPPRAWGPNRDERLEEKGNSLLG